VEESLSAIGEALAENGKVIVTGCLGAKKNPDGSDLVKSIHPKVLAVTGPHATAEVLQAVHDHLPKPHDPFLDLVPPAGVKLTPKHYAYLKISEGCNHRCSFCIIPSMRGDLVSRPIGDVLKEAKQLFESGVKELLVVSQDTSAYGVDIQYRTGFWDGKPVKTRLYDLALALNQLAKELKRMKRPASGEKNLDRIEQWRAVCPDLVIRSTFIAGFPGETEEEFQYLLDFMQEANIDRAGCFAYSPVEGAAANELDHPVPQAIREERQARFMEVAETVSTKRIKRLVDQRIRILVDRLDDQGGIGRSAGDAPEIDGLVRILPPSKPSKRYRVGDFIKATVIQTQGHDLIVEV
ncbi:MAG: radical SAM protein, partial [Burkholderiaceae bacterium]|nr:radical SAM protein [Burkholderiaceae bacterium]